MKNLKINIFIILALLCLILGTALTQAPSFIQEQEATDEPSQEQPLTEEQEATDVPSQEQPLAGELEAGSKLILFREDRTLTMPKSTVSYWFVVPKGISVRQPVILTLHISHSSTLIESLSSVTVFVNEIPVGTRGIVEKNGDEFFWTVEFDSSLIRMTGFNEIKITTVQRSIEGDCADIDNPSNWVVVHSDSFLSLAESDIVDPLLSSYFALYYDTFAEPFTIACDYVLSNTSDTDIVSAMLGLSNASGMYYPDKEYVQLNVYGRNGFILDNSRNKIFVKSKETFGEWDGDLLTQPQRAPAQGDAYVSIAGFTKEYPFYRLFVLGNGTNGLKKATAFLSNRLLVEQAESNNVPLTSDIPVDNMQSSSIKLNEDGIYRLTDFGYEDISIAGAFHQRTSLSFVQPDGVSGDEGSYLELWFRHSDVLLSDRSVLNVYINGVAVSSVKLSPGNTDNGKLVIDLPASALMQPVINVTIETYHYLGKVDCTKDYYDVAWTVIDADNSRIVFNKGENALRLSLENFPYFSSGDNALVSIYAPGSAGKDALEAIAALAVRAGQNTQEEFEWNIVPSTSDLSSVAGDIVIITEKSDAIFPEEITEKLAITSSGTDFFIRDEALPVIPEILKGKAVIQIIRSPWDFYRSIYVIIYDGTEGLANLEHLLGERTELNQLNGQLGVLGGETGVQAFTVPPVSDSEDTIPVDKVDKMITDAEEFTGIPSWLIFSLLAVFAVLIVIIIVISNKKSRGDEYQEAKENHKNQQDFFKNE